jgi:putative thioredoxin
MSPADTLVDFEQDVLAASHDRPVLVDFWAAWCGPCRVLGPILERLEAEAGGAWRLVKIDTDRHPALSQAAGIRGIPAVKLYAEGALVGEFTGALPEPAVRRWLEEHLPSEGKRRFAEASALAEAGNTEGARHALDALLAEDPAHEEARLLLARLSVMDDPERAVALTEGLEHRPEAEAARTLYRFLGLDPAALPDNPAKGDYFAAVDALRGGDVDRALSLLIGVVQRDRALDDDGARRAAVALFQALGEGDPVVQKHRPTFNRSLY